MQPYRSPAPPYPPKLNAPDDRTASPPHSALFATAVATSAGLLFVIQPLFAKLLLPQLGGAPAVWTVCATYYQLTVLVGYLYAHALGRLVHRHQITVHLALLAAGIFFLPPTLDSAPPSEQPIIWLLARLALHIGPLALALSATAPLFIRWFASRSTNDPYFLYASSNAGSLVGLLAYPLVLEPLLSLSGQRVGWSVGYGLFLVLAVLCARGTRRTSVVEPSPSAAPTWGARLRWLFLAFVASSLYLGFTTWATTDIAAVPLLWVLPLAAYLLSFIAAFARRPIPARATLLLRAQPIALFAVAIEGYASRGQVHGWALVVHFLAVAISCFVCHRQLADFRPTAKRLTEYFVWVAMGGVLGGLFNGVLAPSLFQSPSEYPLALVLTLLCRPRVAPQGRRWLDLVLPLLTLIVLLELARRVRAPTLLALAGCAAALPFVLTTSRRFRLTAGVAAVLLAATIAAQGHRQTLFADRTFFGVHRVRAQGDLHLLLHGNTSHGIQSRTRRHEPLGYHTRASPIGELLASGGQRQVAIVGLGTGALAAYGRPGQRYTFYELDPLVKTIARDPALFTYLTDCKAELRVVLGDARLSLESAPSSSYDIIVLDAFSSDGVPVHLVTAEAVSLYRRKLADGGVLAFNVSNRYIRLAPVLAAIARDQGLGAWLASDLDVSAAEQQAGRLPSEWVVLAHAWTPPSRWRPLTTTTRAWSDQFSNLAGALGRQPHVEKPVETNP